MATTATVLSKGRTIRPLHRNPAMDKVPRVSTGNSTGPLVTWGMTSTMSALPIAPPAAVAV